MEQESVAIYRPDGVALLYKVGTKAMNLPGEGMLGNVTEIEMASPDDGRDYVHVKFEKGEKVFSSMAYVWTKSTE